MNRRIGLIPHAGSRQAASFARRRASQFLSGGIRFKKTYGPVIRPKPTSTSPLPHVKGFMMLPSITSHAQVRLGTRYDRFGKKSQLVDIRGFKNELNRIIAVAGLPHIGARFLMWHVARWCLMEMVYLTPYDTGTAAAGWSISPQIRGAGRGYGHVGFRIQNSVAYIVFLEYGHSDQAPGGMQRITFARARIELHNLLATMMLWWKSEQHHLRGFHYDPGTGVGFVPEKVERALPKLTWKRLMSELNVRLPLDKDVSQLNAEAFLAMRIEDPKNWHTVHDFQEPGHIFESSFRTQLGKEKNIFGKPNKHTQLEHVHQRVSNDSLRDEAAKLERTWSTGKWQEHR